MTPRKSLSIDNPPRAEDLSCLFGERDGHRADGYITPPLVDDEGNGRAMPLCREHAESVATLVRFFGPPSEWRWLTPEWAQEMRPASEAEVERLRRDAP